MKRENYTQKLKNILHSILPKSNQMIDLAEDSFLYDKMDDASKLIVGFSRDMAITSDGKVIPIDNLGMDELEYIFEFSAMENKISLKGNYITKPFEQKQFLSKVA